MLTPWYKVAVPREDLRQRKPLDAAQFAVHLDRVAAGEGPPEYVQPDRFFARTYLTDGLRRFCAEVLRRLAGERVGANAVLNLVTGFGGGKTHALTVLYHLARLGPEADGLPGVAELLDAAQLPSAPKAAVACFVGTDWDAVTGRGGRGEPPRRTPWGEIAWQLSRQTGNEALFEAVRAQDEARVRPGKEAIRSFLPPDTPVLILMDEVMNFVTAARGVTVGRSTLGSQFYEFVHTLTEEADGRDGLCVVVSLPKSEEEMSAEDEADFRRLSKVTTRVAEAYVLAKDLEIPEIIRRRLFDSPGDPSEIQRTAQAYARWLEARRDLVPAWFPLDAAQEVFAATYPFHPTVLSVFERKWQALPSFQRTRGILRLLAQWVSIAYEAGFKGAHTDALITLGTAPLEDQFFRAAVLEQLGSEALQAAIISDIAGEQAHAQRLDAAAPETLRRSRIHRKVASAIFFESSGGQVRDRATLPEVRLAVGEPDLEVGNVETALEALVDTCYFLAVEGSEYRFSTKPNLNKLLADRRAALDPREVDGHAREAIRRVFAETKGTTKPFETVFFPQEPKEIPDSPALRLVVLPPEHEWGEAVRGLIERLAADYGAQPRRFRNALVWAVAGEPGKLLEAARRHLAWLSLEEEADRREFDEAQRAELAQHRRKAEKDLQEAVWGTYRWLVFLGKDGGLQTEDLGLLHSSAAQSLQAYIQARLKQTGELTEALAPTRVSQNWPKAAPEWTTKAMRDAVYASPAFPRLLDAEALKETVAKGVAQGQFGYATKRQGAYVSVSFEEPLAAEDVEFSDDVVLLPAEQARMLKEAKPTAAAPVAPETPAAVSPAPTVEATRLFCGEKVSAVRWEGEVPWQKWTQVVSKVLSGLVQEPGVTLRASFEVRPPGGLLKERVEAIRQALDDLGLPSSLSTSEDA